MINIHVTYQNLYSRFSAVKPSLGERLKWSASQFSMNKRRGNIPTKFWPAFVRVCRAAGVALEPGELEAAEIHYQSQKIREATEPTLPFNKG